jgi:hypothetical protein
VKAFCLSILLILFGHPSLAGTAVGNGAGLVEQNIIFTYNSLPNIINGCLNLPSICQIKDRATLQRIRDIVQSHGSADERIKFVSESERPEFFDTGLGQTHRLAKTGLSPNEMIFFNSEGLYAKDGQPALDLPTIAAILIHELGHQSGISDSHAMLDEMGSQVRIFLLSQAMQISYPDLPLKVSVFNYAAVTSISDVYIAVASTLVPLTFQIGKNAQCPVGQTLLGWSVGHIHWGDQRVDKTKDGAKQVELVVWLQVRCLSADQEVSQLELHSSVEIRFEKQGDRFELL